MSGPVEGFNEVSPGLGVSGIEVREGRTASIGRLDVVRVLPTKRRRTIGPWCFVDLMRADDIAEPPPIEIGPHPHIGLATVTWLFGGTVLHTDSLGTEQLIRAGELNLMTAGGGIAHAEEGVDTDDAPGPGGIMGAQMWLALPDETREGTSRFEHLDQVPRLTLGNATAHVFVGGLAGAASPARIDHPGVGADLTLRGAAEIPVEPAFEHGIVPIDRSVRVEDAIVEPGSLALVPRGYERLRLEERTGDARLLLVGGEPLGTEITMWWNFVARTRDEITEAWRAWQAHDDDRFAPVPSRLARIDAPRPPWLSAGG